MPMATQRLPPVGSGRWQTVQTALDSWTRTVRLCLIYLSCYVPFDVALWFTRH